MAKRFFTWFLIFLGLSLLFQSFTTREEVQDLEDVQLIALDGPYPPGEPVQIQVHNQLDQTIQIPSDCPEEPLIMEKYENGIWTKRSAKSTVEGSCTSAPLEFPPKTPVIINYAPWGKEIFQEIGKYRVTFEAEISGKNKSFSSEFEVKERGFLSSVLYELFFRPIYNLLIVLTSAMPGKNLGLGIIALTVVIRMLLLVPNQKAIKAQRDMMRIQPQLEEIKRKYQGDQQRISMETLALWKQHRVNPIGGCLPLLIQIPILIGLFYVVKTGFTPYQDYILYPFFSGYDLSAINNHFYGILDLDRVNATWLPILVGFLQFVQMKLSFARVGKKQDNAPATNSLEDPLRMMNKTMVYFMPIMILLMVASLPSGVGLYLAISTLFGIVQQWNVMRQPSPIT